MSTTNITPPLRASCDRCRAQKLRCVPSSTSDATAPCQRCLRAKSPKSCIFSQRLRTGRSVKAGTVESRQAATRREKEKSPGLPGMSAFALSTPPPSECAAVGKQKKMNEAHRVPAKPSRSKRQLDGMDLGCEDIILPPTSAAKEPLGTPVEFWDVNSNNNPILQPAEFIFDADEFTGSPEMISDYSFDANAHLDVQDFLPPLPYHTPVGLEMEMDMLMAEKPGPLVDLTALLAKMSHYESQLPKLPGGDLDNYPIGDALFLSQRFFTVLSEHNPVNSIGETSHLDMPTKLLTLSCYMTLTRILISVFGYLHGRLCQLQEANFQNDGMGHSVSSLTDMHAYRGLRLGQIQPICACAGKESATRVKKAVSMLLASLEGAEGRLGLPPDVRVIPDVQVDTNIGGGISTSPDQGDEMMVLEDGLLVGLTNSRLHKVVREQARELREKVDEVYDVLKGLLEI
ncbi:hypothetical protein H112_05067 [Trichophyton rubrum D6]|uniref:Zn(2)-C6 fungal-type domain-containing protein n=3 Tax=Trichophyton TaxID=5550 RepID=F2SL08_TRIRC|nr:uncharacterized protein TERG_02823 [Trichophyton rubrum CBS 118892]EZF21895.1 hypothetical protein H100_05091 [Trichophyton rubrum MR850]EZF41065.1 hypothetical protein H102_05076 [Trichophyton rubrum CBS 100081]EZF51571.1 hypothetical protein H103_05078 [Trichophyton rubrum CBS 288.86]EZF62317.1 hypothetical protein H104_05072 [Trichophyton rubrum CBS 289.86]EZF72816.1 hypothetical protein H105_05098 [Trichophyton soudanense CBS 452.61]EZF83531.1 hypothetical protein H110_05077 [Trichophy